MISRFAFQSRHADHIRRQRGFSLLEALIAVVVLSTGLLALAALQSALIRSSVDARIRSAAAAAAVSVFEDLRAGGYNAIPACNVGAPPPSCPISVSPLSPFIQPDPALGAGGFTISYDSQAWFDNGAGGFTTSAPGPSNPPPLAEFKKIDLTVSWADPAAPGTTRSVVFTDIVGPLGANLTTPDLSTLGQRVNPPGPIVRQLTPEGPGVIPIAVGDGTETAATNPKPVIVSQGQKNTIIETRFNVLNFGDGGDSFPDNIVRIQKRVETSVVGCKCAFGATTALTGVFGAQFRPTFWDGTRYVPPELSGTAAPAGPKSNVVQSQLCTECCRDHHDPTGVQGAKFDPFRPGAHEHFNLVNGGLVNSNASGEYVEACRLIRVDGLWRVATDLNDEFFGLLKTTAVSSKLAADPTPDQNTTPIYEEFVIQALKERFVDGTTVDDARLAAIYDSKGLNAPLDIPISRDPADSRWMHARGFFVDHIEPQAQQVIDDARNNCPAGVPKQDCVLPFIPFTTINLTELAGWSSSNASVLTVSNNSGVIFGDPLNPTRGKVNALASAVDGSSANADTRITRSNSGLALFVPIDPDDAGLLTDAQRFTVGTGSGPPSGTSNGFDVAVGGTIAIGNGSGGDDPVVAYQVGSDAADCTQVGADTDSRRDYRCSTNSTLGIGASVVLGSYNKEIPASQSGQTVTVTCTKRNGSTAPLTVAVPMCVDYAVTGVTQNGIDVFGLVTRSTANEDRIAESTRIGFPVIGAEDDIVVVFSEEGRTPAPLQSCAFNGNSPNPGDAVFGPCP